MQMSHSEDESRPVIRVAGLRKSYGHNVVLRGVDLSVDRGQIFSLLGPNGAGKTTVVNIASTLVSPDSGSVEIAGFDVSHEPARVREVIALTGQFAAVDEFQSGRENLTMMCQLAGLSSREGRSRTGELLELFDLLDAARRPVRTYSGGMRRRLDLAASLISRPPVLFLDEPTTGLDPRSRAQMWQVVRELATGGTTILLTTQYLEEADQLAHRIAVLDHGTIIATGTAAELKSRVSGSHVEIAFDNQADFATALALDLPRAVSNPETLSITVPATTPVETIRELLRLAAEHDLDLANITVVRPTLDDVFITLTGRPVDSQTTGTTVEEDEAAA